MKTEIDLHPTQASILRELLFKTEARFSELNIDSITNDHFSFHVNKLVSLGLIIKNERNKYELTIIGKEFANRFDTDTATVEKQAKIGVLLIVTKREKGKELFLVHHRLKQPYYGYHGFITGKVRWGETVIETAHRELKEEAGIDADLSLGGVEHKMDYSETGELLDDKYFYIFKGKHPSGTLRKDFEGGENLWLSWDEVEKLPDLFDDMDDLYKLYNKKVFTFLENKYKVKRF